jgi:hypothetical protein
VASLDPIARVEFMRDVMAACAEGGLTVVIASHRGGGSRRGRLAAASAHDLKGRTR